MVSTSIQPFSQLPQSPIYQPTITPLSNATSNPPTHHAEQHYHSTIMVLLVSTISISLLPLEQQ